MTLRGSYGVYDQKMRESTVIAFDLPGVLVSDAMPRLVSGMAKRGGAWSPKALWGWYQVELAQELWAGQLGLDKFWQELMGKSGVPEEELADWKEYLVKACRPLLDHEQLASWAEQADLAILANGIPEWHAGPMRSLGLQQLIGLRQMVLSSVYSAALPDQKLFHILQDQLVEHDPAVLYISASEEHCQAADDFGWGYLIADPEGIWIWELDRYLNLEHQDPLGGYGLA